MAPRWEENGVNAIPTHTLSSAAARNGLERSRIAEMTANAADRH